MRFCPLAILLLQSFFILRPHGFSTLSTRIPHNKSGCRLRSGRSRLRHAHDHSHHDHDHNHSESNSEVITIGKPERSSLDRSTEVTVDQDMEDTGHSHSHHGHSHNHFHLHIDTDSLRRPSKRMIARMVVGLSVTAALPAWKRTGRVEILSLIFGGLAIGALDVTMVLLRWAKNSTAGLQQAWSQHFGAQSTRERSESSRECDAVTWLGVFINLGLSGFKMFAGIVGNSAVMVADAVHSLSDLVSDAVTLFSVRLSSLAPDEDHPYGHGRFEALGALSISVLLIAAGFGIGVHAYEALVAAVEAMSSVISTWATVYQALPGPVANVLSGPTGVAVTKNVIATAHTHGMTLFSGSGPGPSRLCAVAAMVSVVVKEALYRVTATVGRKHNSQVLIANAYHHRTDAVSSVVALVAIVGSMAGLPILDPAAGIIVAGMVAMTGLQVAQDAVRELTDTVDYTVRLKVAEIMRNGGKGIEGVISYDSIRTRQMGTKTLVDLTVQTDTFISASAAGQVAERVRMRILKKMPQVSEVVVKMLSEEKPCPVLSTLRTHIEVEDDVNKVLKQMPEITAVPKVLVHYTGMVCHADVFIRTDPRIRVHEAIDISAAARSLIQKSVPDLCDVNLHLDLTETYMAMDLGGRGEIGGRRQMQSVGKVLEDWYKDIQEATGSSFSQT